MGGHRHPAQQVLLRLERYHPTTGRTIASPSWRDGPCWKSVNRTVLTPGAGAQISPASATPRTRTAFSTRAAPTCPRSAPTPPACPTSTASRSGPKGDAAAPLPAATAPAASPTPPHQFAAAVVISARVGYLRLPYLWSLTPSSSQPQCRRPVRGPDQVNLDHLEAVKPAKATAVCKLYARKHAS